MGRREVVPQDRFQQEFEARVTAERKADALDAELTALRLEREAEKRRALFLEPAASAEVRVAVLAIVLMLEEVARQHPIRNGRELESYTALALRAEGLRGYLRPIGDDETDQATVLYDELFGT